MTAADALTAIRQRQQIDRHSEGGDVRRMAEALAAVLTLHKPWRVYDECACIEPSSDDGNHVQVDEIGLTCAVLYLACRECCSDGGDGEYQTEECANSHEHTMDDPDRCPTVAAITQALGGGA